jgi:hypothetical protein
MGWAIDVAFSYKERKLNVFKFQSQMKQDVKIQNECKNNVKEC